MIRCDACAHENPNEAQFCMACGAALVPAEPASEVRKTVSIVFCDITDSTALGERLDPETLSRVMQRYFDAMRTAIERHGGTVEKFIGDAVMAVFGAPVLHEDDALRAVRAAEDMREALVDLNEELQRDRGVAIRTRTGVNTGEVLMGVQSATEGLVTGDAVNVAARLEQAAQPGEILLGWQTFRLARDAVEVEAVEPLDLKGKSEPVAAFRLIRSIPGAMGHARRMDSPMVGRESELQVLAQAFDRTIRERTCMLFTLMGSAGVGKSRLSEEFLGTVGDAHVLRGRCLHYGEGITYWPVVEILSQAAGIEETDTPDQARAKLTAVLDGAPEAAIIETRIGNLLGIGGSAAPDETFWAIRKLLETLAVSKPVVVIFDDIHWAEPTLFDLIEHIADWSRDAPILVLCMARPELLEERPGWGGGKMNATAILLEPLEASAGEALVANLLGSTAVDPRVRERVLAAAGGNPLFVEEMLDLLVDRGVLTQTDGAWVTSEDLGALEVPPTITALIASRLERLPASERTVLEHGSVEGSVFHRGAVQALERETVAHDAVGGHLMDLVRKELIRPDRTEIAGDDAFRFRHLLIRDAAYHAMTKRVRADLHERFAAWLEALERVAEVDEIAGYHLEQARRYLLDIGQPDDRTDRLAAAAADHLIAAGAKARGRGDDAAATTLLSRAALLLPTGSPRYAMTLCDISSTSIYAAATARTVVLIDELSAAADATDDSILKAHLSIASLASRSVSTPHWDPLEWIRTGNAAIAVFGPAGDHLGLARAYDIIGWANNAMGRFAESTVARQLAFEHGALSGDPATAREFLLLRAAGADWGPMPASEGIALCREIIALGGDSPIVRSGVTHNMAVFEAIHGEFATARRLYAETLATMRDIGRVMDLAFAGQAGWQIGCLTDDFAMAEREIRQSEELLEKHGVEDLLSVSRDLVGEVLYMQGRYDEAEVYGVTGRDSVGDHQEDVGSQWGWRRILGNVAAGRGDLVEAERLLREAFELGETTDALFDRAYTNLELAAVLQRTGQVREAHELLEAAARMSEAHEDVVTARKARERLAAL